jgi:hypothetical protein
MTGFGISGVEPWVLLPQCYINAKARVYGIFNYIHDHNVQRHTPQTFLIK